MTDEIYVDTYGQVITVETDEDLTSAASYGLKVKKPSGDLVTWYPTVSTTKLVYTTASGDLDEAGTYYIQAYVEWATGTHRGRTAVLEVYANFTPEV